MHEDLTLIINFPFQSSHLAFFLELVATDTSEIHRISTIKAKRMINVYSPSYISLVILSGIFPRKILAELFNITRDNIYHPKHNWTILVQEHLNKSLGEEGLIRQSLQSKPAMFLSHPLPECSCSVTSSAKSANRVKSKDGRFLFGDEDECPKWMKHANQAVSGTEGIILEDNGSPDYESNDFVEESESDKNGGKTNLTLIWEQDEEMDPND